MDDLIERRLDAVMDNDGHCSVCGCEVREYESADSDEIAMGRHVCPPGFRTPTTTEYAGSFFTKHKARDEAAPRSLWGKL